MTQPDQHLNEWPEQPRQPYQGHPYPLAQLPPQIIIQNTANAAAAASGTARPKTAHGWHLLATILTGGLWAPIWIWRTIANNRAGQAYARAGR